MSEKSKYYFRVPQKVRDYHESHMPCEVMTINQLVFDPRRHCKICREHFSKNKKDG